MLPDGVAILPIQLPLRQNPSAGAQQLSLASLHGPLGERNCPPDDDLDSVHRTPPVPLPYLQAYWQLVTCRPRVGGYCGRPINHPRSPPNSEIPDDGYLDCPSPSENFPTVQQIVTQKPVAQDGQTSAMSTADHGHMGHTPAHPRSNMSHTWKLELQW